MHPENPEKPLPLPPVPAGPERTRLDLGSSDVERRAALHALQSSEARLQAVFHQAAVGIAIVDLEGHLVEVNQKFCDILESSKAELLQRTFHQITHPEDLAVSAAHMDALVAGSVADFSVEKRYVRPSGDSVWSSTTVTLIRDAVGVPSRFLAVVRDISGRRAVEAELREETRNLELMNRTGVLLGRSQLDLAVIRQTVIEATTEIAGAELGLFRLESSRPESSEGSARSGPAITVARTSLRSFGDLGHPSLASFFSPCLLSDAPLRSDDVHSDPRFAEAMGAWGTRPTAFRSFLAVPIVRRNEEDSAALFFLHSEPGAFSARVERRVVGVAAQAAVALDNARLYAEVRKSADVRMELLEGERSARESAERLSSLKDEFLSTLSHELRTPLSAILGWAQVLRRGAPKADDLQKGLEAIERNARVQTRLIEELLDMSRITSGRVRLDVQQVDPASVIEAAIETVRPAAEGKGIRIERLFDSGAGPISGDPARLQQILWNLLSNAIKFTPRQGKIQILLQRVNSSVEISVSDTGTGIQPEFLPLVFERFRQADGSSTRSHGGLGMGLAIVKHLVELHGGTVKAASAGEGRGSTFVVRFPLSVLQGYVASDLRLHSGSESIDPVDFRTLDLSGTKVVAVDDDQDARELIRRVLSECAAEVFTAASAEEALRLIEAEHPDVLVSDIGMPEIDGYELLRRVRLLGSERGGDVPVIALTAFARSEDRTRALHAGFRVHVSKPIEPSELVATVASVSGRAPGLH
ncbi:MAG: ATP-binding protein [Thermoanaerobaculia bacterium]